MLSAQLETAVYARFTGQIAEGHLRVEPVDRCAADRCARPDRAIAGRAAAHAGRASPGHGAEPRRPRPLATADSVMRAAAIELGHRGRLFRARRRRDRPGRQPRHRVRRRHQAVRRGHGGRGRGPRGRARLVLHLPGAVGLRQDHLAAPDRGLRAAECRRRADRRAVDGGGAALPAAGEHGVPALRPVPASRCRGQHRLRAEAALARGRARRSWRGGSTPCSSWCACPATARGGSGSCRAGSSSGWRWRARWSTGRPCCCSTSRWRRWTASCGAKCRSSCRTCSTRSASPSSWSPTTRRRRCR